MEYFSVVFTNNKGKQGGIQVFGKIVDRAAQGLTH